jgi:GH25 family lysozyme M1 (1,4-beta-N-acetylmuramidase)
MTRFIDRSNVNGTDDYKKAGITHLYLKATESSNFTDATYVARKRAGIAAGAVVGAYHFAGHADPVVEAEHFLGVIAAPKAGHLRPCLDLESGESAAWTAAFVEHLHSKLGYWPVLYGNTSTIPGLRAASASVRACPWWRAEFGPNDGQHHALSGGEMGAAAHQYTSVATFPGITGHTDASVFCSAAGEAAMLVGGSVKKHWPKPDHWGLDYTDVQGHRQHIKTRHPGLWQARHRHARDRGELTTTPVFHPIKK